MDEAEKALVRRVIEMWRVVGPLLEEERRQRLTDDDVRMAVVDLLSLRCPDPPEPGSGLSKIVEIKAGEG